MINLIIIRMNNSPNKIKTNAFDGIRNIELSRISNFVVFIRKNEKIIPTIQASSISERFKRNSGNMNINAPELIKIGGSIIFLKLIGFLEDLIRIKFQAVAINNAMIVLAISKKV